MSSTSYRIYIRLFVIVATGSMLLICSRFVDVWENTLAGGTSNAAEIQFKSRKLKSVNDEQLQFLPSDQPLGDGNNAECRDFHTMPNITDICKFVNETDDCHIDEGFINYTFFVYCTLGNLVPLAVVILFLWWLFLFVGLAVTADDFFCPSLTVISKTLHLSHNIAGVTFLAFGNGAPDIFSAIAAIGSAKNGDAGLAVGALFGAGVFVTTVVAGVISVVCPFDAMQRPFLRDVIFYLAAVFFAFYVLWDKQISKFEALGFIGLYIVYVVVVVIGRYIYQRGRYTVITTMVVEPPDDKPEDEREPRSYDENPDASLPVNNTARAGDEKTPYNIQDELLEATVSVDRANERSPLLANARIENYSSRKKSSSEGEDNSAFIEFLQAVNPIDTESWSEMRFYAKGYEIFKSPLVFFLKLTVPVVDYSEEEHHNWNRHLNSLQCFTGPVFAVLATKVGFYTIASVFPVWGLVMIIGALLGILALCVTRNEEKPRFHAAFAYLGFVVAVIWIYSIANEIVNILQTFGIVFNISDAILGLTFLAWGNSIGDLIADFAMARQGYPRMGISACFGGPLFNMLLGIGIPFTIGTFKNGGNYMLKLTLVEIILAAFLCLSLISSLIIVPMSKFRMSRPYGIFLFALYGVFIVVAMLAETNVIHAKV